MLLLDDDRVRHRFSAPKPLLFLRALFCLVLAGLSITSLIIQKTSFFLQFHNYTAVGMILHLGFGAKGSYDFVHGHTQSSYPRNTLVFDLLSATTLSLPWPALIMFIVQSTSSLDTLGLILIITACSVSLFERFTIHRLPRWLVIVPLMCLWLFYLDLFVLHQNGVKWPNQAMQKLFETPLSVGFGITGLSLVIMLTFYLK
ncbi:hypothetical protein EDD86DRAFT_211456 [Gorgonomyces haynaldii]|nr:hypothetical protein EDD86DRAFT_211456 [Gorgonomyces haynaldii]